MVIKIKKMPPIDKSREWNSFVKCNDITGNRGMNRSKATMRNFAARFSNKIIVQ